MAARFTSAAGHDDSGGAGETKQDGQADDGHGVSDAHDSKRWPRGSEPKSSGTTRSTSASAAKRAARGEKQREREAALAQEKREREERDRAERIEAERLKREANGRMTTARIAAICKSKPIIRMPVPLCDHQRVAA